MTLNHCKPLFGRVEKGFAERHNLPGVVSIIAVPKIKGAHFYFIIHKPEFKYKADYHGYESNLYNDRYSFLIPITSDGAYTLVPKESCKLLCQECYDVS